MTRLVTTCAHKRARRSRPGFAIAIVLWSIAVIAVMLVGIQVAAYRQAASGREALARVRATWAARAGVEAAIASIQGDTRQSTPVATVDVLAHAATAVGSINLDSVTVRVEYADDNGTIQTGVFDTHARINVNLMSADDLMLLPNMTEDVAAAIVDYIDANDDTTTSGAEAQDYQGAQFPYVPRNAPIRSLRELDRVKRVTPDLVRGADLDLDNIVTRRESESTDAANTTASSALAGWSSVITAASSTSGLTPTGEKRIDLTQAQPGDLTGPLGVNTTQAQAIISAAQQSGFLIENFLGTALGTLAQQAAQASGQTIANANLPAALTRPQLAALYDLAYIGDPKITKPGKININTVSRETLDYLTILDQTMADALIEYRDRSGGQVASMTELYDVEGMNETTLATLAKGMDVHSVVFVVTAKGRDTATGIQVEMIAEIDRSTMPMTIRSLRVK